MPIKIIDLSSETSPTDDDYVVIRDNATNTTKKISRTVFFSTPPYGVGSIPTSALADGSVTKVKLGSDAKISVRVSSNPSPGTLTPDMSTYDMFVVTALNGAMTFANPIGSPINGQGIMFRITDNGSGQGLSFASDYRGVGVTLPTSTVAGKLLYMAGRWNQDALTLDILSVGREA